VRFPNTALLLCYTAQTGATASLQHACDVNTYVIELAVTLHADREPPIFAVRNANVHDRLGVTSIPFCCGDPTRSGLGRAGIVADQQPASWHAVPPILPPQDGYLFLDRAQSRTSFVADVSADAAAFMADSQVPWGIEALNGAVAEPGAIAEASRARDTGSRRWCEQTRYGCVRAGMVRLPSTSGGKSLTSS
jgi:hypothetical protein